MRPLLAEELGEILDTRATYQPWWQCPAWENVRRRRVTEVFVVALAGMAEMPRTGADPIWVAGGPDAFHAATEAGDWLAAGVVAHEIAHWLRASCHRPGAAVALSAALLATFCASGGPST